MQHRRKSTTRTASPCNKGSRSQVNGLVQWVYMHVLEEGLLDTYQEVHDTLGGDLLFQQDNAPIHIAGDTQEWLEKNNINYIDDCRPIRSYGSQCPAGWLYCWRQGAGTPNIDRDFWHSVGSCKSMLICCVFNFASLSFCGGRERSTNVMRIRGLPCRVSGNLCPSTLCKYPCVQFACLQEA